MKTHPKSEFRCDSTIPPGHRPWAIGNLELPLLLAVGFLGLTAAGASDLTIGSFSSRTLDTRPAGTPHVGDNDGVTWLASSSDGTTTRAGVMQFVATNRNQITLPGTADFDSDVGTIMFWLRTAGAVDANPGDEGAILFDWRTGEGTVLVLHDNGQLFEQHNPAGVEGTVRVDDGDWHHVAMTYDQNSPGSIALYVDGALDIADDNAGLWTWPVGQQIELGTSHDVYWRSFNGFLDDVRVYNRRLTLEEVGQVRNTGAVVDDGALVLRFNFDAVPLGVEWNPAFPTLQSATNLNGTFLDVPGATSPYIFNATGQQRFFRARQ